MIIVVVLFSTRLGFALLEYEQWRSYTMQRKGDIYSVLKTPFKGIKAEPYNINCLINDIKYTSDSVKHVL